MKRYLPVIHGNNETPTSDTGSQTKIEKLQIHQNKFSSLSGFVRNKKKYTMTGGYHRTDQHD